MNKKPDSKPDRADDATATAAGSVYYRQDPEPRPRYTRRTEPPRAQAGPAKRPAHLGHAILLSNIRTFTLVTLFMVILAGLAAYITTRTWQSRQEQARSESPRAQPETPPTPEPRTPGAAGVFMDEPDADEIEPHVRTELDTEAMRRAIFMQQRAESLLEAGDVDEAILRFRDALDIWPQLTRVWAKLGGAYLETGEFQRAQIALERAAENDPGNPSILNDLGVALLYQNRITQAIELFETVTDMDPQYASAHFNRALCYLAQDDDENAEEALDAFLRLRPNDARALKEKAYLQASRRDYQAALEHLRRALSSAPDWPSLYVDLAATTALMGRADEAINYLDRAEALTSPSFVYRVYQQPAFREIRLTEAGRSFEERLAERAREMLAAQETEEEPISLTRPMHSAPD